MCTFRKRRSEEYGTENEDNMSKSELEEENESEPAENKSDSDEPEYFLSEVHLPYRHMPCLSHTTQLIIRLICKKLYGKVLGKARSIVKKIRKSSMATQDLIRKAGKSLIADVATRWNSSYLMTERLADVREHVEAVLTKYKFDGMLNSEWEKIIELMQLIKPFTHQTNVLQSDKLSLSLIVPALIDLKFHLQQFPVATVSDIMLKDFNKRFATILEPATPCFNPLPAAATIFDPSVVS